MKTFTQPFARKIIHLDMDMFFVAVEIRDRPELANLPVCIGGPVGTRGVLSTANYVARKFGVKSAMPTSQALKLCPDLVVLPGNMKKYKEVSNEIFSIFKEYSDLVEGLSLDEAFIDVSHSDLHKGSATLIAKEIKDRVYDKVKLTVSAGVAPNKLLAKLGSDFNKPNGLTVIPPDKILEFISPMPVARLFGIGKVSQAKLETFGIKTCHDMQSFTKFELAQMMGNMGETLYEYCRGIDQRKVVADRPRKSVSVERTFNNDIVNYIELKEHFEKLKTELLLRWEYWADKNKHRNYIIKSLKVKIKTKEFLSYSIEEQSSNLNEEMLFDLFNKILNVHKEPLRLLGLGIRIEYPQIDKEQQNFFNELKLD